MTDGNLHALERHLEQQEADDHKNSEIDKIIEDYAQEALDELLECGEYDGMTALDYLCENDAFDAMITNMVKANTDMQWLLIKEIEISREVAEDILNKKWEDDYYDCE